jgi:hypothetical protein
VAGKLDQVRGGESRDRDHHPAEDELDQPRARVGSVEELLPPPLRAPPQRERIHSNADHQADDDQQEAEDA